MYVRNLQPGQQFILLRTGERYKFLRREHNNPRGTQYICLFLGPMSVHKDHEREATLHHSCHVFSLPVKI